MLAFLNDPAIKRKYVKRVNQHAKLDEIIKGKYWENGKGCAVGCVIHSNDHMRFEKELGIPVALAYILDKCFEGSSNAYAQALPGRFLKAAKPGADLAGVTDQLMLWVTESVQQYNIADDAKLANQQICALYKRKIAGDSPSLAEWSAARSAAWSAESAARSAAWSAESAAESAARSAARSAAWSAESAESAARSAAESAAESAARSAAWSAARSAESAARSAESAAWSAESAESAAWSAESAARSAAWSAESAAWSAAWSAYYEKLADQMILFMEVA